MKTTIRTSNFELLRIICMLMIVTLHVLNHGGALYNIDSSSTNFFTLHLLESFSIVAVNCYILITGFFGITSNFKFKKILNLYIQLLFYSMAISLFFFFINLKDFNLTNLRQMLLPITSQLWWFMSIFLILYLLTPYINKLLKSLTFKEFNHLLIILIFVFIIWPSLPNSYPLDATNGYSLYNFILLYILGAYIKLFYDNKEIHSFLLLFVYIAISITIAIINMSLSKTLGYNSRMYSYDSILIFISSVTLFLFFKNLKICIPSINKLATLTLGIYLIHDHPYIREIIYSLLHYESFFNTKYFFIYTIFIVIVIYTLSSLLEYIRQILFKLIKNFSTLLR